MQIFVHQLCVLRENSIDRYFLILTDKICWHYTLPIIVKTTGYFIIVNISYKIITIITARVRSTIGKVIVSLCYVCPHLGGGVRSVLGGRGQSSRGWGQSRRGGRSGLSSRGGGGQVSPARGGSGQVSSWGVRSVARGVGQVSSQGVQVSSRGGGVSQDTTTEGVLTTRRAVCLLRSRRRTFLLCVELRSNDSYWYGRSYLLWYHAKKMTPLVFLNVRIIFYLFGTLKPLCLCQSIGVKFHCSDV